MQGVLVLTLALTLTSGQLGSVPRSARLVEAQVPADAPMATLEPEVSSAQLKLDLLTLKRMRPSIGAGVGLLIGGTVAAAAGGLYLGVGLGLSASTGVVVLAYLGGGIVGLGLPLALVGVWLLITRTAEREPIDNEIVKLNVQLQQQLRREQQRRRDFGAPPPTPSAGNPGEGLQLAAF